MLVLHVRKSHAKIGVCSDGRRAGVIMVAPHLFRLVVVDANQITIDRESISNLSLVAEMVGSSFTNSSST